MDHILGDELRVFHYHHLQTALAAVPSDSVNPNECSLFLTEINQRKNPEHNN
jgi:hypothetical protein